jgi:hypothetical protein
MKRFFDWMVRGLDAAAERKCAAHELERVKAEHAAEKKGLIDAHERHLSALQAQIRNLKASADEAERKLSLRPYPIMPEAMAKRIREEKLGYAEKDGHVINLIIPFWLRDEVQRVSDESVISFRQIISGMVYTAWPSK